MNFGISFSPLVPATVIWAAAAVVFLIALLLVFSRSRGALMRAVALALFVLALANPSLTREDRDPLTSVAVVVIDKSPSQDFGDRTAQTEAVRAQLAERLGRIPNLEVRFVEAGQSDGETDGTRLFAALSSALSDVPHDRIAGAIMITDGRVHDVPADVAALGFPAPVHGLITGHANERDRRVVLVTAPRFGIVGQTQAITFKVDDQGPSPGTAQITIRRDGEQVDSRSVRVGQNVSVNVQIAHAGPNIVEIEASPIENELTEVNNRAVVSIDGVRDKLRVLLVSGEPHAGERTWRNLLKSDASVDLVHFTILRPPEKQDGTPINELSLIAFPTRELFQQKINEFQLIIFDRYARQGVLPIIYFDNIARYVRAGGAVLVAAGPDYASQTSIWRTPLEVILPAEPNGHTTAGAFRAALTDLGKRHPVTRGLEGADENPPHWSHWFRLVDSRTRKGTTVMHGPGRQAAARAVARRRGPRRAAAVGPHLAVGARLRRRRTAHRSAAAAVALADEAARSRGRSAAPHGARTRPDGAAPDHVGQRRRSHADDTVGQDQQSDAHAGRAGRLALDHRGQRARALARHRRHAHRACQCRSRQSARVRRGDIDRTGAGAAGERNRRRRRAGRGRQRRHLPRVVAMRSTDTYHGEDWIGLRMREASVVRGIGVLPVFAGLIGLLLLVGALAATWAREGR